MSTLRKKVFTRALVKCFSFYGSNYSDSLVFGNVVFGQSKITVLERHFFKKKVSMEVLRLCLLYGKRYFQEHQ